MSPERYHLLMASDYEYLTKEEMDQGWHFCPDWDFLLIHPDDPEAGGCLCTKD